MQNIHCFDGKVTLGVHVMAALIKRSGRYDYRVRVATREQCVIEYFDETGGELGTSSFTIDDVVERHEVLTADTDIEIASGTVAAGTISGMRFEIVGVIDGEERLVVEHVTRLRDEDAPHWPQGEGYRILVEGEPHVHVELSLSSDRGDHNHAGCLATAMHVVNAIPHVVAASPGVKTYRDLPVYSAHPAR